MRKAILCVSFGTSVPEARESITAVEETLRQAAPDRLFLRAFTSPTIRRILAERGEQVPGVSEAERINAKKNRRRRFFFVVSQQYLPRP